MIKAPDFDGRLDLLTRILAKAGPRYPKPAEEDRRPMTDEQRRALNKIWGLIFDWHESAEGVGSIVASERIEVALLSLITSAAAKE